MVEGSRIISGLYMGSAPAPGLHVRRAGFRVLVLCADEYQCGRRSFDVNEQPIDLPAAEQAFPGVLVLQVPLHERASDLPLARTAAKLVALLHRRGRRVLVTCRMGRNRSGIVTALALRELLGLDGARALDWVRDRRPHALQLDAYKAALRGMGSPASNISEVA